MSTKALDEALDWLENYLDHNPEAQEARRKARKELEAIRKAAKVLSVVDTGDVPRTEKNRNEAYDLLAVVAKEDKP